MIFPMSILELIVILMNSVILFLVCRAMFKLKDISYIKSLFVAIGIYVVFHLFRILPSPLPITTFLGIGYYLLFLRAISSLAVVAISLNKFFKVSIKKSLLIWLVFFILNRALLIILEAVLISL